MRLALAILLTALQIGAWPTISTRSTFVANTNHPGVSDWSAANKIAFYQKNASNYYDLYTINPDGTGAVNLIGGAGASLASSSGKSDTTGNWCNTTQQFLAYTEQKFGTTGEEPGAAKDYGLWIVDYPGLAHPVAITPSLVAGDGDLLPRFSKDCTKIAWAALRGGYWYVAICNFSPSGSTPNVTGCIVTDDPVPNTWYYEVEGWTPDNSAIFVGIGAGFPKSVIAKVTVNSDNTTGAFNVISNDHRTGTAASWTEFYVQPFSGTVFLGGFVSSTCGLEPYLSSVTLFPLTELYYLPTDASQEQCPTGNIGYRLTGVNWPGSPDFNNTGSVLASEVNLGAISPDGTTLLVNFTTLVTGVGIVREISKYTVTWPADARNSVVLRGTAKLYTK